MPKISVIMTTYNRVDRLKKAVKSVQNQTFKDWELIIVDDHSNDKTQKYCQKLITKDDRIRYFRTEFNSGCHSFTKNKGSILARTELIAYLDDDNQYRPDHLQALYKYLGDNDIVYGDRWIVLEENPKMNQVGINSDFNVQLLSQQNYIDTSDVLIRKKALEDVGGWDEHLRKFADWNLWIRLAKAGYIFQRVPIIITDYHVHDDMNQKKHSSFSDPKTGRPLPTFHPDSCFIYPEKTQYGERKPLKVAVYTLTMNRLDYTKKMYQSMTNLAGYDFDWFVIDNGSSDGTQQWLKTTKAKTTLNKENVGISRGSNQALDAIGNDYDIIIKVDNDCLFKTNNWLTEIVSIFQTQRGFLISPRVEGLMDSPGGVPRTNYIYVNDFLLGMVPHIGGVCVAAHKKVYSSFRWEENDFLHGSQDHVFSQYAVRNRYALAYMENTIVEHMDTTAGQIERYPEYFEKRKTEKTVKWSG